MLDSNRRRLFAVLLFSALILMLVFGGAFVQAQDDNPSSAATGTAPADQVTPTATAPPTRETLADTGPAQADSASLLDTVNPNL